MNRGASLVCLLFAFGCHRVERDKPAPPPQAKAEKTPKRAHEIMVYVDGAPRASLTQAELPAALVSGRAPLCDYLRELGTPCASVHGLHLYREGGAVEAAEPAALQLEIDGAGRALVGGAPVTDVAVYVDKPAPALPVKGIPYLDEPVRGGTRVNLDGRLLGRMKRNQLDDTLSPIATDGEEPRYALTDFLAQLHVNAPRALELVTPDDGVVRVPDEELARVSFSAERQRHGQMSFHFGARSVSAVAVNVYAKSAPPDRAQKAHAPVARQAGFSAGCDLGGAADAAGSSFLVVLGVGLVVVARRRLPRAAGQ